MNDPSLAGRALPTTIPQYLAQLRAALEGADPAMVQDALYDAEEYLRSELAAQPGRVRLQKQVAARQLVLGAALGRLVCWSDGGGRLRASHSSIVGLNLPTGP